MGNVGSGKQCKIILWLQLFPLSLTQESQVSSASIHDSGTVKFVSLQILHSSWHIFLWTCFCKPFFNYKLCWFFSPPPLQPLAYQPTAPLSMFKPCHEFFLLNTERDNHPYHQSYKSSQNIYMHCFPPEENEHLLSVKTMLSSEEK